MFDKVVTTFALFTFFQTFECKFTDTVWTGLTAKWTADKVDGFYPLPQRLEDARSQGWTEVEGASDRPDVTSLGYVGDPRYILRFSKETGDVAGIQTGFPVVDSAGPELGIDYTNHAGIIRKTLNGVDYFTSGAYFFIDSNGTRRLFLDDPSGPVEYPTDTASLEAGGVYLKKNCYTMMGTHYYQMNSTMDCSNLFPWALLVDNNQVVGLSWQIIGSSSVAPTRRWSEANYTRAEVLDTIPDAPECFLSGTSAKGLLSIHHWWRKDPTSITCSE